jgi:hypothetical protein
MEYNVYYRIHNARSYVISLFFPIISVRMLYDPPILSYLIL